MKTRFISLLILFCGMLLTGCNNDSVPAEPSADGYGTFSLSLLTEDVQTELITRAETQIDVNSFKVTLKDNKNITLIDAKAYENLSDGDRTLPSGIGYQISVESCTQEESTTANDGWGKIRFIGNESFNIVSDQSTPVTIDCDMVNAGLQLVFDDSFIEKFPTYAATTQDVRLLVFKGTNTESIAYYEVEDGNTKSVVPIRVTGSAGGWSDRVDLTREVELTKGKITKLSIIYDENTGNIDINIGTDTGMDDSSDDVTIQ